MKHPQITSQESPVTSAGSAIPWSAEGERALRESLTTYWVTWWICFICGILAIVYAIAKSDSGGLIAAAVFWSLCVLYGLKLLRARDKLGEPMHRGPRGEFVEGSGMLANKPRSTQNLTTWIQHPVEAIRFDCVRCGAPHWWAEWDGAQWCPNFRRDELVEDATEEEIDAFCVDPGGGRWVILCPCGIGHFKLKES